MSKCVQFLCFLLSAVVTGLAAPVRINVDFERVAKADVNSRAVGINLCWLLDSDLRRQQPVPMTQALAELRVGTLRFPYGHLADNYLWHTPPYENTEGGLRPRVASMKQTPGKWTWAVKPDGSMPGAMDFDEYMALCAKIGARALVCVNALSHKYPRGPAYEQLKQSAVEWVAYARKRGYRVAFWQIGNEVEHKENARLLPMDEYVKLYADFAQAMKEADPEAQIGPGILASPAYYRAVAKACPQLVDVAAVHQYLWKWQKTCPDYAGWRDNRDTYIDNIERAAKVLAQSGLPHVKLLVTETGVTGGAGLGQINNTYKALWCFELLMNGIAHPSVGYAYYWGTHSPWGYQGDEVEPVEDSGLALRLRTNARTPTGEMIRLINGSLLDEFLATERVQGRLRCYAMRSRDGRRVSLMLLNKDDQPAFVAIPLGMAAALTPMHCREFVGQSPADVAPVTRDRALPEVSDATASLTLSPLSVTIMEFGG